MQVVISPYDASLGNFTGGGINAITKQGTNKIKGSLYYVIANEKLTGKTPNGDKAAATRFAEFNNKTSGFTLGGPIVKNKLFFFINAETQKNAAPQPFNTATYLGSSSIAQINALAQTLKGAPYNYDPGDFIDNADTREATRIATRFDWNINAKHKLTVSYRYSELIRNNPARSTASTINFYNNGELFPSVQNSASLELKSVVSKTISNNLLISLLVLMMIENLWVLFFQE
jgi:outer membrane receptor for ferrienterochelin and colicin